MVLPCRFMVLSAVMQTAAAASMMSPTAPIPPVSLRVAVDGIRGKLPPDPPLKPTKKPPDPDPPLHGEGRKQERSMK